MSTGGQGCGSRCLKDVLPHRGWDTATARLGSAGNPFLTELPTQARGFQHCCCLTLMGAEGHELRAEQGPLIIGSRNH